MVEQVSRWWNKFGNDGTSLGMLEPDWECWNRFGYVGTSMQIVASTTSMMQNQHVENEETSRIIQHA